MSSACETGVRRNWLKMLMEYNTVKMLALQVAILRSVIP